MPSDINAVREPKRGLFLLCQKAPVFIFAPSPLAGEGQRKNQQGRSGEGPLRKKHFAKRPLTHSLSLNHRTGTIRAISRPTFLGSGDNSLRLIPVRRAFGQMLMVYLPNRQILHTAELVQPLGPGGSLLFPEYLQEVTDAVRDAGIQPTTMIGMHMSPTPWSRVAEAIAKADAG